MRCAKYTVSCVLKLIHLRQILDHILETYNDINYSCDNPKWVYISNPHIAL